MSLTVRTRALAALALTVATLGLGRRVAAQTDPNPVSPVPSVRIMKGPLVAPNPSYYGPATSSTNGICANYSSLTQLCTGARPPEVKELARALKGDPNLIYEYIRNSVDTEFQFGLQKGAMGVIIDGSGTPFDQASLMVELLRESASNNNAATLAYGTLTLSGTAFYNWTGISDATAACNFLATGGIPAAINGSSPSDCSGLGTTITTVTVQHLWVQATVNGQTVYFDPSYKPFTHKAGITASLASTAGLSSGAVASAAAPASGSDSGGTYYKSFNQTAVASTLQGYASNLLTRLKATDMQGADMTDVVGGHIIQPLATRPSGGWGQANLNTSDLTYSTPVAWPVPSAANVTGVPDQFRTTLRMTAVPNTSSPPDFDGTFFVDEIYGRRLMIQSTQVSTSSPQHTGNYTGLGSYPPYEYHPTFMLDGVALQHWASTYTNTGGVIETLTLVANHPFAAIAPGGTLPGTYGDATAVKVADTLYPTTIVHGWGRTSEALSAKWREENGVDTALLKTYYYRGADNAPVYVPSPSADLEKSTTGATWLAQFSQAADLHAELANARMQHLHTIGVIISEYNAYDPTSYGTVPPPPQSGFVTSDQTAVLDVESAFGLTVRTSDPSSVGKRRAALHAIAATASALEGSVFEQLTDTPDAASTARRFAWGNAPEIGETPDTSSRKVYDFTSANASAASAVIVSENSSTGYTGIFSNDQMAVNSGEFIYSRAHLAQAISNYTAQGFDVVASNEAMLGPGYRNGTVYTKPGTGGAYLHFITNSTQVGGTFVANLYDSSGNPTQIAHVVLTPWAATKGGGGTQTDQTQFNASSLSNSLKDRFVDRSTKLAVDLKAGKPSFSSPILESIGQGEFPYSLERKVELRGSGLKMAPVGDGVNADVPNSGFVSNWQSSADPSSSASEAMGQSRVEATAPTIAAFMAMQDVWSASPSITREVTGELVADWWGRQVLFNVVTISHGSGSEAFVKLADGTYLPTQGGGDTVSVTGVRTPVRLTAYGVSLHTLSGTRQWRMNTVGITWKGLNGDSRQYAYWEGSLTAANKDAASQDGSPGPSTYWDYALSFPVNNSGFRLNTWQFPYGVQLTLNYAGVQTYGVEEGAGIPTSVTSSLGWTLNLPALASPWCGTAAQTFSVANLAGETTKVGFNPQVFGTGAVRPVGSCQVASVYEPVNSSQPAIAYTYDTIGRIMSAQDAVSIQKGLSVRAPYQFFIAPGYRGEWDDPMGGQYAVETMQGGRFSRTIDEIGRMTTTTMDGRHRVLSRTFPLLDQEQFAYNAIDQVTQLTKVPATIQNQTTPPNIFVHATYDPVWNKLATLTDARNFTTTLSYYGSGNGASMLQQAVRPEVGCPSNCVFPTYSYQYNSAGQVTQEVDPTGVTTTHGYDTHGDLKWTTLGAAAVGANPALNLTTNFSIDIDTGGGVGNVTAVTDPRGYATTTQYDVMRRKTDEQRRNGGATATSLAVSHWHYDLNGRADTEQHATALDASGNATAWATTTIQFTPTSQKAQVTDPLGNVVQTSYDGDDRPLCTAVRTNASNYGSLPDACTLSSPASTAYGPDRITKLSYDAAGQMIQETRAYGVAGTQITYATYAYEPDGQVQFIWDANNNKTTYAYDGFDRLIQTNFPSTTRYTGQSSAQSDANDYEAYTYDPNGNRLTLRKRDQRYISWCYDSLNREVDKYLSPGETSAPGISCGISTSNGTVTAPTLTGIDVATLYDPAGRKTSALYASSQGVVYQYNDAAGRLTSEATNGLAMTYGYDSSSNRSRMTWWDGFYVAYQYDALNRVSQVQENGAPSGPGLLAQFQYDPLSRRTTTTFGDSSSATAAYDASHLTSLAHAFATSSYNISFGTFTYSPAHQLLSRPTNNALFDFDSYVNQAKSSTANGLNQDATIAALSDGYDLNGNETDDGTRQFAYDVENKLTGVTNSSAATTVSYAYDPTGRLQQEQSTVSGSTTTTQFVYSGDKLVAEYSAGAIVQRYVHGAGSDDPIVWYAGSTTANRSWLHADNQGTIIATSTANAVTPYTYGAYGEPNSWSGERFRYTGQIILPASGLYYYKARVYDPVAARFLQSDPIGYSSDLNIYAYVRENPANQVDATGLCSTGSRIANTESVGCTVVIDNSGDKEPSAKPSSKSAEGGYQLGAMMPSGPPQAKQNSAPSGSGEKKKNKDDGNPLALFGASAYLGAGSGITGGAGIAMGTCNNGHRCVSAYGTLGIGGAMLGGVSLDGGAATSRDALEGLSWTATGSVAAGGGSVSANKSGVSAVGSVGPGMGGFVGRTNTWVSEPVDFGEGPKPDDPVLGDHHFIP
ncbi:RHS repeat-associated core domain-containing protein [Caulobacter sp. KR2-114]|uniref:RHS repeat domain-containing protein n=1 Tax=Caulobacter sp. KR2-114 TaxID=3400912 RepID=UPI003C0F6110